MKKIFYVVILALLIMHGALASDFSFEGTTDIGQIINKDFALNEVTATNLNLHVDSETSTKKAVFTDESSTLTYKGTTFAHLKPGSSIVFDRDGNIANIDISTNEQGGGIYTLQDQIFNIPSDAKFFFDGDSAKLTLLTQDLYEVAPMDPNIDHVPLEVEGSGGVRVLYDDKVYPLTSGAIVFHPEENGAVYASAEHPPLILGVKIEDGARIIQDLEFDDGVIVSPRNGILKRLRDLLPTRDEEGVHFLSDKKVSITGNTKTVIYPHQFIGDTDSRIPDEIDITTSRNAKYFTLGDTGDDVKVIQQIVGAPQNGIYDDTTAKAVRRWQQQEGLSTDGKFGSSSLKHALQKESEKGVIIQSATGTVQMVSANDDLTGIKVDVVGDSGINVGQQDYHIVGEKTKLATIREGVYTVGAKGEDVAKIQEYLVQGGYLPSTLNGKSNIDGIYGPVTSDAVKNWQKKVYADTGTCLGELQNEKCTFDGVIREKSIAYAKERSVKVYKTVSVTPSTADVPVDVNIHNPQAEPVATLQASNPKQSTQNKDSPPLDPKLKRDEPQYVFLDRSSQRGYFIKDGKIEQSFRIGVGKGNDPQNPNPELETPAGEFTVDSIQFDKPIGKWASDQRIPFTDKTYLKPTEGYSAVYNLGALTIPIGKLASVYGPGFIVLRDSHGNIIQQGIHGTSIAGQAQLLVYNDGSRYFSHGCVRMTNAQWLQLNKSLKKGTKVFIS